MRQPSAWRVFLSSIFKDPYCHSLCFGVKDICELLVAQDPFTKALLRAPQSLWKNFLSLIVRCLNDTKNQRHFTSLPRVYDSGVAEQPFLLGL